MSKMVDQNENELWIYESATAIKIEIGQFFSSVIGTVWSLFNAIDLVMNAK